MTHESTVNLVPDSLFSPFVLWFCNGTKEKRENHKQKEENKPAAVSLCAPFFLFFNSGGLDVAQLRSRTKLRSVRTCAPATVLLAFQTSSRSKAQAVFQSLRQFPNQSGRNGLGYCSISLSRFLVSSARITFVTTRIVRMYVCMHACMHA